MIFNQIVQIFSNIVFGTNTFVMDKHHEGKLTSKSAIQKFTHHLLQDIKAMELMVKKGMFERDITRIGAEQEICLVNSAYRPISNAPTFLDILKDDDQITNELPKFNLEVNLSPAEFTGNCLSKMEQELQEKLAKIYATGKSLNTDVVLAGILPTIRQSDLTLENMTPNPRYMALNKTLVEMRGGAAYDFRIHGTDELMAKLDSIMFETCNTSFQVHYQVSAEDFVSAYNWAQIIAAPVLAVATNSPLLLGKRLWRETRIALFQQATDTRGNSAYLREQDTRVLFGNDWIYESVVELFKEDAARHRVIIASEIEEDSLKALNEGKIPDLKALRLHNGTVYKWNRPCYGIMNGVPHLRIENRVLPSGPTVVDEMANTTFWLGLMYGMPKEFANINKKFDFDLVKTNFFRAAQMGMGTAFRWVDNKAYSVQDLVLNTLLPIARAGLEKAKIAKKDIDKYLGIIEARTKTGKTGSQWMLDNFNNLKNKGTMDEAIVALTAGMAKRQKKNVPVHKWTNAKIDEAGSWVNRYWRIEQIMSKNLYTIKSDDLIDMATNLMHWKNISYIPVEDDERKLVGLITYSELIKYYSTHLFEEQREETVKQIMIKKPICISSDTLTIDAINTMRKNSIDCLPVVDKNNVLVGLVTEHDFVNVADHFLQEFWAEKEK